MGCSIICTIYYNIPFICIVAATVFGTTKPIRQLRRQRFALIASVEITIHNAQYNEQKESASLHITVNLTKTMVSRKEGILFRM